MFREALATARNFTHPIVASRRTVAGKVSASIGTYVTLNKDGWIITAGHVIEQIQALDVEANTHRTLEAQHAAIDADSALGAREKCRRKEAAGRINRDATTTWSAWWGRDDLAVVEAYALSGVDLGLARLEPADPQWFHTFPVFKDPTKDFEPEVSLCKLGFPFHSIQPHIANRARGLNFQLVHYPCRTSQLTAFSPA
jgi:hypothetical protein